MDFPNKYLQSICTNENILLVDMKEQFSNSGEQVFYDFDEHLNINGHLEMATAISKGLSNLINTDIEYLSTNYFGDRYPSPYCTDSTYLFQSIKHGNSELFITDYDHSFLKRLTFDNVHQLHPCIDCENNLLFYTQGDYENMNTKIVMMDLSNNLSKQILTDDYSFESIPTKSPQGNLITYAKWNYLVEKEEYTNSNIFTYDIETGKESRITDFSYETWRPIFSGENQTITYIGKKSGNYDLFSIDLKSLQVLQLTSTPYDEWDPNYSSDGQFLIYSAYKDSNWDLFLLNLQTDQSTQLTFTKGNEWDPIFTKDNDGILFAGEFGSHGGIYKMKMPDTNAL